jgi:golgi phosphoprotein 3
MTSNGGLSRRRVPAGGSSSTSGPDDDGGPTTSRGSWSSPNANSNGGSGTSSPTAVASAQHAGSAFEGGSKIAFDPRDLERDSEDQKQGGRAPRLTIMEEVLLLGLKDKQVSFRGVLYFLLAVPQHLLRPTAVQAMLGC